MFETIALANDAVLVQGTDVRGTYGSTVVDGKQWNELNRRRLVDDATKDFDAAITEFFAPVVEAAEKAAKAVKVELDPLLYIVEQEGTPGTPSQREHLTHLEPGSVILRAIAEGHTDRLIWVNGELLVTAAPQSNPRAGLYDHPQDESSGEEPFGESPAF